VADLERWAKKDRFHMTDRSAIIEFWRWFELHRNELDVLVDSASPLWDKVLVSLHRIHKSLWFELSRRDGSDREFIITAEGQIDVFPVVEALVAQAPTLAGWQFLALKPPMGFDFSTTYESVCFDPRTMWFLPLDSSARPENLGLRIGVPDFAPVIAREAKNAVLIILDTGLGERSAALDIQHVEVASLPDDPATEGFIELPELPAYIAWRKRKKKEPNQPPEPTAPSGRGSS
jgi:hypothetical protein